MILIKTTSWSQCRELLAVTSAELSAQPSVREIWFLKSVGGSGRLCSIICYSVWVWFFQWFDDIVRSSAVDTSVSKGSQASYQSFAQWQMKHFICNCVFHERLDIFFLVIKSRNLFCLSKWAASSTFSVLRCTVCSQWSQQLFIYTEGSQAVKLPPRKYDKESSGWLWVKEIPRKKLSKEDVIKNPWLLWTICSQSLLAWK